MPHEERYATRWKNGIICVLHAFKRRVPSGQIGQGAKRINSDGAFHPHPHAIRGGGIAQTTQDTTSSEEDVFVLEPDEPGGTIASNLKQFLNPDGKDMQMTHQVITRENLNV